MTKKGFTTIELIVSLTLTAVIVVFLFQIIFTLKDLYINSGIKIKLLTKQATINTIIYDDLTSKSIIIAKKCGDNCVDFYFNDGSNKELSFDRNTKIISYGDYATNLVDGSEFGNIIIKTEVNASVDDINTLNGILTINIPVYHSLIEKEDFGVNLIYLYNSYYSSMSGLDVTDIIDAEKQIYLINEISTAFEGIEYSDPGYYVLNTLTSEVSLNDPSVIVSGIVDTNTVGNYYKTYTLYDMNGNVMDTKTRTINVVKTENTFEYTGELQMFNVPIDGVYKIELWGASGGGNISTSGRGGYTVANYELDSQDKLYLYVGGQGSVSSSSRAAIGGFNGGGNSGTSTANFAGSGGGATDIRLNTDSLTSRILVAGGGGGGGSRNDSTITCNGGTGGGLTGGVGTCTANSYLGGAGTPSSGGAAATYSTNITTSATAGALGIGGAGASYASGDLTYAAGGGGGGYYGGGGGSRYGGGGGGSALCGGVTCNAYDGTSIFSTTDGKSYETGHIGNGFIKITLLSIR